MKNVFMQKASMLFVGILMPLLVASCYNKIEDEAEESDIPLQVSTHILPLSTRMTGDAFEEKDAIGLFLLTDNQDLSNAFISNKPFYSNSSGLFTSDEVSYYPKKDESSRVIAYYPYSKKTFDPEEKNLSLSVGQDQSTKSLMLQSDFLIADKEGVKADYKPLRLDFEHCFAKIKIRIKPSQGYTAQQILNIHPVVTMEAFPSTVNYDVFTKSYSACGNQVDIHPFTQWVVSNDELVGCELIVLPQQEYLPNQQIAIMAEDVLYRCALPQNFELKSGTVNEFIISYNPSKGIELTQASSTISEWGEGGQSELTMSEVRDVIARSSLSFAESSVLNIESSTGEVRAVVCEEFLNNEDLKARAVVAYPVENEAILLDQGVVLSMQGGDVDYQGKQIKWDKKENTFQILEGNRVNTNYLFVNKQGHICYEEPSEKERIGIVERMLVDKRGSEVKIYPLQKIGTQLWIKKNLDAAYNIEGEKLAISTDKLLINAGYRITETNPDVKLYNFAALESEKLAPTGWLIPQTEDWKKLYEYVSKDINYLKAIGYKDWSIEDNYSNISGFSISRDGVVKNGIVAGASSGFLILENGTTSIVLVQLLGVSTELEFRPCERIYQGGVRCLKNL